MAAAARGTTALVWGAAATLAFIALRAVVAVGGHEPLPVDHWWNDLMGDLTSDVWLFVAWVPAVVGGTVGMIVIGALLIAWLLWRRRGWDAATLAVAMVVVVAIGASMAAVIGRTRPEDSLAESVATSFPSGHTAVATTVVMVLALVFRQWYVWAAGLVWVLTMMWSRTYLHAHWVSDVVAGMLEGVAVATIVWACMSLWRTRRAARAHTPPSDDASISQQPIERSAT
ncbi:phosphatase PAP2 family protein [uncultured Microbacterium sp.]|uniref:phosphatase PAP2 family protein n=1 Tax=uncultured Microbacterium sp. TaxID=191216 RepID=UPI0028D39A9A|nr:phosphatase PAP2 family protein [uncultured Microbacterium sp.]